VSRHILLDAGPLGLLTTPRRTPPVEAIRAWLIDRRTAGDTLLVPEIADYEVRRELLRAGKARGIRALDALAREIGYLPITTLTMRQAALYWSQLRRQGTPTAAPDALDGDVILAAQATLLAAIGHEVVAATANVAHPQRLVRAAHWQAIR
jgi:predicted nucleic acid-binding protein